MALRTFNDYIPSQCVSAPENWRRAPGGNDYLVSDFGRVLSLCHRETRILKAGRSTKGYYQVSLHGRTHAVHRLVCEAFHGAPQPGEQVRHLDGDKANNTAANLAWGTSGDNARDTIRLGRHNSARKTACPSRHEYAEHGYSDRSGKRRCRRCEAGRSAARRAAAKQVSV